MSVLTKLFVVLLVISSLLLSASVVVFVNRVENYRELSDKAANKLKSQVNENNTLMAYLSDAKNQLLAQSKDAETRISKLNDDLSARDLKEQQLNGQVAKLERDAQVAAAQSKGLADALKASQTENQGLQMAYTEQRNKNDELLRQNGELNTTVTLQDQRIRAEQKRADYGDERIAGLINENKTLKQMGGKAGGATGGPSSNDGGVAPATGPINGVVRSVDVIAGKKYATISVGSADNVTKGTKFNVIDRNAAKFLGFLTVDQVEPHEAIGQLEGQVDKVQAGAEVKTQLGQ